MPLWLLGDDGPAVRFVECAAADGATRGRQVEALLERGWRPDDVALLTTGSRHLEQVMRQDAGQDSYLRTFWDADQVFYGHVLGFKGMERRAVVLAINKAEPKARSRERLYVGLSRARDELVVVGDPATSVRSAETEYSPACSPRRTAARKALVSEKASRSQICDLTFYGIVWRRDGQSAAVLDDVAAWGQVSPSRSAH